MRIIFNKKKKKNFLMYFNSIFENQAINNKGAALPDKYREHVDVNGNRLAAFTQNLTALTG